MNSDESIKITVFISYAREDGNFVFNLKTKLENNGIECLGDWLLTPAMDYEKSLHEFNLRATMLLFIISPDSIKSVPCLNELYLAVNNKKGILPISHRDHNDDNLLDTALRTPQWIFLRKEEDFAIELPKILQALKTDFDMMEIHSRLLLDSVEWIDQKRKSGYLLKKDQLKESEEWLQKTAKQPDKLPQPTPIQIEYILASQRARTKSKGIALAISMGIGIALLILFIIAWKQRNIAQTETQKAQSLALAALAREQLDKNPTLSIRLAELAWEKSPTYPLALPIQRIVSEAFYESIESKMLFFENDLEHTSSVTSAFFSPDGKKILTISEDNTAKIWDAASGSLIANLKGHTNLVYSAAFSRDGKKIVTASRDSSAKIWDVTSGNWITDLKGHHSIVYNAAFSWDGKKIVTASYDNTAKIWDAVSGKWIADLKGHIGPVYSAAFSPDGKKIVTASFDRTAKIWDATSDTLIADLKRHNSIVNSAAFSLDGKKIVSASKDSTAKIWDAASGNLIADLKGHTGSVYSAAFSRMGKKL